MSGYPPGKLQRSAIMAAIRRERKEREDAARPDAPVPARVSDGATVVNDWVREQPEETRVKGDERRRGDQSLRFE